LPHLLVSAVSLALISLLFLAINLLSTATQRRNCQTQPTESHLPTYPPQFCHCFSFSFDTAFPRQQENRCKCSELRTHPPRLLHGGLALPAVGVGPGVGVAIVCCQVRQHAVQHPGILWDTNTHPWKHRRTSTSVPLHPRPRTSSTAAAVPRLSLGQISTA